jgi:hypothetical protein
VRASIGLGTTCADIDRLVSALGSIARIGPGARYAYVDEHDEYQPAFDSREWPCGVTADPRPRRSHHTVFHTSSHASA